ncbi:MAG: molecular chaperone DnaJ, partial [Candidatus Marinimicrobia bacterium]|nr:molecular chaperone DnaJ [Candidatus Neomarinimicrobiota bacterium]
GGFDDFDISDALRTFMDGFGGFGNFGGFGDIFGGAGGGGRASRKSRGSDMRITLRLSLEEIYKGIEKQVKIKRFENCDHCNGSGGSGIKTCQACQGRGEIHERVSSFLGQMVNIRPCGHCQGEGMVVENKCRYCRGEGREKKEKLVTITVPAGVSAGNYMTLQNEGNSGIRGSLKGSLIVVFDEIEHPVYTRHGEDLYLKVVLTWPQVVLGDDITVPTLAGKVSLKIASGIQSGKILRLRSKGLPRIRGGGHGDLFVRVQVDTPSKVRGKEQEIISQLQNMYAKDMKDNYIRLEKFKP